MSATPALGEMRSRVSLERPADAPDDTGALMRVWTEVADLWARIAPLRGAEFFSAGEQETVLAHEVTIRWRPDVAAPMRFRLGSRALYIRAAFDPDARRRTLVCRCEEYVA
jgi:SPP1 family predicted phage head-tail adaptor